MELLSLLLVLLQVICYAAMPPYFVKPDDASSLHCPADQSCLTIDEYTQQIERYFTTGSIFVFLAGNHMLHYVIHLNSISQT